MRTRLLAAGAVALIGFGAPMIWRSLTAKYDEHFMPYDVKALGVWFYPTKHHEGVFLGRVPASYDERRRALNECGGLARAEFRRREELQGEGSDDDATELDLADWGYVCCTVTPDSDCLTKVR